MSLLYGQAPPALPAMHHPILYPVLLAMLIVTGLLLLWWLRMMQAWQRWRRQPAQTLQGWRRIAALALPLILPLA